MLRSMSFSDLCVRVYLCGAGCECWSWWVMMVMPVVEVMEPLCARVRMWRMWLQIMDHA